MKKILFLLIVFIISTEIIGQIIYYDAIEIRKNCELDTADSIIKFNQKAALYLATYFKVDTSRTGSTIADNLNEKFESNPFFDKSEISGTTKSTEKIISSFVGKPGALDVSTFSKGMSSFLIERAKEELNIAFFQKFKKTFEKHQEFEILFPNTTSKIVNLLAYQYNEMLPILQEAFIKDMEILPESMIDFLLLEKYYTQIKDFPEFLLVLESFKVMNLVKVLSPPQLIDTIPVLMTKTAKIPELSNYLNALELTKILSNAVRDTSRNNYWITPDKLYKNIFSDDITMTIFMGLIYEKISDKSIGFNNKKLTATIKKNDREILWYKSQFSKLTKITDKVNNDIGKLKELKDEKTQLSHNDIYNYVNSFIEVFDFGNSFIRYYNPEISQDKYISLAKELNSLYINVVKKEYPVAMNNAINIIEEISIANKDSASKKFNKSAKLVLNGMNTYGRLIANISVAETPDEVSMAIKTVALPRGSSSIKKYQSNNVAINAYLGGSYNYSKGKSENSNSWNSEWGLIAPIGVSWTPLSFGNRGAISLFGSVIDIGAIVDYELKENNTDFEQKIFLKNIFSPGLHLVYGFGKNLPLSVGIGGQYGPGLTEIGNGNIPSNPTWRGNIFMAVDIPVINLYQGKKVLTKQ